MITKPYRPCLEVSDLFEEQVEKTPNMKAAVMGEEELTYRELNIRANRLAHYLQKCGVGLETPVVLYFERTLESLVGILAVLKAGGAYIPVDTSYPWDRLAFILEQTEAPVVLTRSNLRKQIAEGPRRVICLDTEITEIETESPLNPVRQSHPESLAYIIYTSGSTGEPKGVMIPHKGLMNYLSWCIDAYSVADGCGSIVHSSFGFDLTITSIFPFLLSGGQILMLAENETFEGLAALMRDKTDLSLVKLTPSHLDVLNQLIPANEMAGRTRAFVIGGEALNREQIKLWQTHAPQTRLYNEYGPTETVVGCCVHEVHANELLDKTVPIGRPIANTQLYVLDRYYQPVPVGVLGELYISGDGVARGYLSKSGLTAERFIPNPFSNTAGSRMYRTGDLACYRIDGILEFHGRTDHQVKYRGYRIELGEIEAVLRQCPKVNESVVLLREDKPGRKQLVAYVTTQDNNLKNADLKDALRQRLPEYMIPSVIVQLKRLPLTLHGKIDRQALPAPRQHRTHFGPPSTINLRT